MSSTFLIFTILLVFLAKMEAIPTSPVIGINLGCESEAIEKFCKPEHLYCLRSACSQCILRNPFNSFVSFCAQLAECVCNISNDEMCQTKISETCF